MPWSSTSVPFPLAVSCHNLCDIEIKTEIGLLFPVVSTVTVGRWAKPVLLRAVWAKSVPLSYILQLLYHCDIFRHCLTQRASLHYEHSYEFLMKVSTAFKWLIPPGTDFWDWHRKRCIDADWLMCVYVYMCVKEEDDHLPKILLFCLHL